MRVEATNIEGLLIFTPDVFSDARGFFLESYNKERYLSIASQLPDFVQTNLSKSTYGVIRGLHFQHPPYAQAKLVSVISGKVLDVAVDLRPDSKTFGKHFSIELTGENHLQLFIPKGFAHGFSVLSDEAVFEYKCSDYYNKDNEGGILWNDPLLAIDWKLDHKDIIISPKDTCHPTFAEFVRRMKEER